jgi:hypothetical protein
MGTDSMAGVSELPPVWCIFFRGARGVHDVQHVSAMFACHHYTLERGRDDEETSCASTFPTNRMTCCCSALPPHLTQALPEGVCVHVHAHQAPAPCPLPDPLPPAIARSPAPCVAPFLTSPRPCLKGCVCTSMRTSPTGCCSPYCS